MRPDRTEQRERPAGSSLSMFYAELAREQTADRQDRRAELSNVCAQRTREIAIAASFESSARKQARIVGAVKSAVELGGSLISVGGAAMQVRSNVAIEQRLGEKPAELLATLSALKKARTAIGGVEGLHAIGDKVLEPNAKALAEKWPEQDRATARVHKKQERVFEARATAVNEELDRLAEDRRAFEKLRG